MELSPSFPFSFEFGQGLIYLTLRKGLAALCTLVNLIGYPIVNQIVGEINAVKANRKVVNGLEVLILAAIAQKVIPNKLHLLPP
jgi:hypothetical protein